jgi:indole-3-acetate monooxygenase
MTYPAGHAQPTDAPVLHNAIAMAVKIRDARDEIERGRRIPRQIVEVMKDAGIFGMAMPRAWGGPELDPLTQVRVIEALAMVDGSVGWCAMINCDGGYVTAFLDDDVGRAMFPDIQVPAAAAVTITGQATRVPGGYRMTGRFLFASGCQHCDWVWLGRAVVEDGKSQTDDRGVPETRQCLVKRSSCKMLDTWYTTGLRGTGSSDLRVDGVFVEGDHTFNFRDAGLINRPGPLYAFLFISITKMSAPALGIARRAIDTLVDTACKKPARRYTVGERLEPPKLMCDEVLVQEAVGRAETMLTSARAYIFEVVGDLWTTLVSGGEPTPAQIAHVMIAPIHVIGVCVGVVQLVCKAAGGTAVYQTGPDDRCLRDILAVNQHSIATLRTYEMAGRLMLGLEPLRWYL